MLLGESQRYLTNVWTLNEWKRSGLLSEYPTGSAILSMSISLDGTQVLFSSDSDSPNISIWDLEDEESRDPSFFTSSNGMASAVTFSLDGSYVASGFYNHSVAIFDLQSPIQPTLVFKDHSGPCNSVVFSPDNRILASGSDDHTVRIWSLNGLRSLAATGHQIVSRHSDSVRSVAFSPNGTFIVSGSDDHTICVTDVKQHHLQTGSVHGHSGSVISVAFSSNNRLIASGSSDCTIRLWNIHYHHLPRLACFPYGDPIEGHTKSVNSIAFSPNGTRIVSGSTDLTVRVWDVRNGRMVAGPFRGHTRPITSVLFLPDSTRILSGSDDGTIQMWDAEQQNLQVEISPEERPIDIFQPKGMVSGVHLEAL